MEIQVSKEPSIISGQNKAEELFELAQIYRDRTDFIRALEYLEQAEKLALSQGQFQTYLKTLNLSLRMYAELEDDARIDQAKEKLQDLVLNQKITLSSRTYYALALCSSYKGQIDAAKDYAEKALSMALAADNKEDICYAISAMSIIYTSLGRYDEALKEIYNLQVFFQVLPNHEIQLTAQMMNGHILRKQKKFQQALDVFWQAYESLKVSKNLYLYVSLLYAMGLTHGEAGDVEMASMYLNLAKKSIDPHNLKHLNTHIDKALESLGERPTSKYDLIFNASKGAVIERKKGRVDFKSQFILMDMLKLFLQHPGQIYSKEDLVSEVWKQEYDPSVHDNKIYVTIKRLRRLIEPDFDKPRYIFRAKNGYYLNKDAKVFVEN